MLITDMTVVLHERAPVAASFGPGGRRIPPLDIGRHRRRMQRLVHYLSPHTAGTGRDRIPACFSTAHHATAAEYADEAVYWQEQGWKGYKLHPPRGPWLEPGTAPPVARHLSIPLLATEITPGGLTALPATRSTTSRPGT